MDMCFVSFDHVQENTKVLQRKLESGEADKWRALVAAHKLEQAAKALKSAAMDQMQDHDLLEGNEAHGCKFVPVTSKRRYDFKHIEAWQKANEVLKAIEARAKSALSASEKGTTMVIEKTGEVVEPAKVTFTKASLTIK